MQLNEEQTLAVRHPLDRPACLIAGAGSGKTRVLTERVRWLMDNGIIPRKICAITFTNRASGELIHRLGLDDEASFDIPRVSTIHSLALRGIRRDPRAFGLKDKATPLDDYDQKQMMKKIVERRKLDEETMAVVYRVLDKISFHRARGVGFSNEYTDAVHEQALIAHAGYHAIEDDELELWKEFEHEKRENSVVDFDDMLHLVVRRMRGDPKFLTALQKQFDHVLMDEAQDTNPVQWEFINGLLRPDNMNFYAVGDMSQSIFGFNGAVPELLRKYSQEWRGVQPDLYRIARNHRSVPEVVAFANMIQNKMTRTIPLKMESWRGLNGDSGVVSQMKGKHAIDIAATIATEIQAGVRQGIAYKDNAILVRAAIQIRDLEGELVRRRIPYIVRGGRGLLATEEVRDVMAYLRLAANHKDFMSLVRAASAPRCGVGDAGLEKIRKSANEKYEGDLIKAAEDFPNLVKLRDVVEHTTLFKANPIVALDKVMTMTGYRDYVKLKYKRESNKVHTKLENLERFGIMVVMLAQDGNFSLDDLIFQLTLDRGAEEAEERKAVIAAYNDGKIGEIERDAKLKVIDQGSVTITTIHQAKGLEWNRVYILGVTEGSLPHKFSSGSDEEIEEERRLWYVAVTRAKNNLVICVPKYQLSPDGTKATKLNPSRFLTELGVY